MASFKYIRSLRKKLTSKHDVALSILRKENTYLKKIISELCHEHSQNCSIIQGFISLEMLRLERSEPAVDEGQNKASSEDNDSSSDEPPSNTDEALAELRNQLTDALEKNEQWLEYDQGREAYVKELLNRMLWLENQLNEANRASSQRHNEAHSDEQERMTQMQEYYEKLLQKAREKLDVLREQRDTAHEDLIISQNCCKEKEKEVEALRQQLDSEGKSRREQDDHSSLGDEEEELSNESEDGQTRLESEKRRSVHFKLQEAQPTHSSFEVAQLASRLTTGHVTSTPRRSLVDESFLECPKCQALYRASHYQELLAHIDICQA